MKIDFDVKVPGAVAGILKAPVKFRSSGPPHVIQFGKLAFEGDPLRGRDVEVHCGYLQFRSARRSGAGSEEIAGPRHHSPGFQNCEWRTAVDHRPVPAALTCPGSVITLRGSTRASTTTPKNGTIISSHV